MAVREAAQNIKKNESIVYAKLQETNVFLIVDSVYLMQSTHMHARTHGTPSNVYEAYNVCALYVLMRTFNIKHIE